MDANYDYFLDFTQDIPGDEEYKDWLDNLEAESQGQETPEDFRF
jgi:hypothetical protein